ncbi:hypothetical protein OAT67_09990 [Bacteriovoracaceae bacterium]|nr:hypothetical protein [Bacteriovoracaceae bacterium]
MFLNLHKTIIVFVTIFIISCSTTLKEVDQSKIIVSHSVSRSVANKFIDGCVKLFSKFANKLQSNIVTSVVEKIKALDRLEPKVKSFNVGSKEFIELTAKTDIMSNSVDYNEFLENTVEVVFTPIEPFGHIRLRIGKELYGFEFIKNTISGKTFIPTIQNSNSSDLINSHGAAFVVGKNRIQELKKEIQNFYKSSSLNNFPPFDAYSSDLEIIENGC